jgi:hypothetical protein
VTVYYADSSAVATFYLGWAQPGDTIALAPGTYSGFGLKGQALGGVTVTSADPANPASIVDLSVQNSSGVTFSGVTLVSSGANGAYVVGVGASSDVHFDHVSVHGSLDNNPADDPNGFGVGSSSNISITNSELQQLGRVGAISSTSGITITGNNVHDIRSDGFDFGAPVDHVLISGNTFRTFVPSAGDHPDAIQFWTSGATASSHDITISGNVIDLGNGAATQGIFFRDQLGNFPYLNVTISDNVINGTGYNGIRLGHMQGLTITDNLLISNPGKTNATFLLVENSDHVTSMNNQAISISYNGVTNLTQSNDVTNSAVDDHGAAALNAFAGQHPESAFLIQGVLGAAYAPYVPPMVVDTGPPPMVGVPPPMIDQSILDMLSHMNSGFGML